MLAWAPILAKSGNQTAWPVRRSGRQLLHALGRAQLVEPGPFNWLLDCSENCLANRLGEFDRREVGGGIKIVLARLIDDAKLLVLSGFQIGQELINLPGPQVNLVARVLQENDKFFDDNFHYGQSGSNLHIFDLA